MDKYLFTSDLHLGDDRMKILGRPHDNEVECGLDILNKLKKRIDEDTHLYVVGDLSLDKGWLKSFNNFTTKAKSRSLIKGNYDNLPDEDYKHIFDYVTDSYIDVTFNVKNEKVKDFRLHHYPSRDSVHNKFSLCGHIHGAWKVQKNMLNLSVDCHHFQPLNLEQIFFYINAICDYYDEDVWVHDHKSNQKNSIRGKKGSYWHKTLKIKKDEE